MVLVWVHWYILIIILIIGNGPADGLDDTTLTVEKEYSKNFTEKQKKFCFRLHWNGLNSYIFTNGVEIYKFKAKDSERNAAPSCLHNVPKASSVDKMKMTELYGDVYDFSVNYDSIHVDAILDIYKQIKKHDIK